MAKTRRRRPSKATCKRRGKVIVKGHRRQDGVWVKRHCRKK
ncbi:MAG TPA: hypothetical protein VEP90_21330 [Methylomirabilota bacterium]|nr:hypothetical protein [Methylomirabilota bacterium]